MCACICAHLFNLRTVVSRPLPIFQCWEWPGDEARTKFIPLLYVSTGKKVPQVKSGEEKPRSKLRLVLKPLPNDEDDATGDCQAKPGGCCGDTCAGGQEVTAESANEKCSSQGGLFSSGKDESSSCKDSSESQLPLPSSQGNFEHIDATL